MAVGSAECFGEQGNLDELEEALLEWSGQSGEYRIHQKVAAHVDGPVDESNGYEMLVVHGDRSGTIRFAGDDAAIDLQANEDIVVANLSNVLHQSGDRRGEGNWTRVVGPPNKKRKRVGNLNIVQL